MKRTTVRNLTNRRGWRTERKILVFESDDWGSIRMPSKKILSALTSLGDNAFEDPFNRYDAIEGEKDLINLKELLSQFQDVKGNAPVMTMNYAMANPDFENIKNAGFETYYYEPFPETYKKYPNREKAFDLLKSGIKDKVFYPQLHCREHLNVHRWMKDLYYGKKDVDLAFSFNMISIGSSMSKNNKYAYMDSFNYDNEEEIIALQEIIKDGADLFEKTFGYRSESFIASCYIWDEHIEKTLSEVGIRYIQGGRHQLKPGLGEGTDKLHRVSHVIGERNDLNQIYLIRNCMFEPSWRQDHDWVESCLEDIENAFKWKKPATIGTHRLNYIGYIDEENRNRNLELLNTLISRAIKRWPDIEFLHTSQLGKLIQG